MKNNKLLIIGAAFALAISGIAGITSHRKANELVAADATDNLNSTTCSSFKSATTSWHDGSYVGAGSGLTYNIHYMGGGSNADGRIFAWNASGYLYVSGVATRELKSVTITTAANTKSIGVYAANTAYSAAPSGNALTTLSATTSGATYTFTGSYKYLALKGTASSTFIKSISIVYGEESITPEINVSKSSINVSKGEDATFVVSTTNLKANFSITGGNSNYFTTSYTASSSNGDHLVTLHGVETTSSPISLTVSSSGATSKTVSVSVVNAVYYEKVVAASSLKVGNEIVIGKTDGSKLLNKYVAGNNSPAGDNVPNAEGKLIETNLPEDCAILTLGGEQGAWILTDQNDNCYYGTSGQNYLKANTTNTDTWSISISSGVATIKSAASNHIIEYNDTNNIFGTYTGGQQDVSIYMIASSAPELQITIDGSTSLGVGESAILTATKLNGASGTVSWATNNASALSLSATTGDSVTVTAGSVLGNATITASLAGCDSVQTVFTVRKGSLAQPYSVAEAISAIDNNTGLTNVYVDGIISEIDTLNSNNTITYWISDDGTTTTQLEVYHGLGLNGEEFSSIDDVEVGAIVTVNGNLKKYGTKYEFDQDYKLVAYRVPTDEDMIRSYLNSISSIASLRGKENRTSDASPDSLVFADKGLENGVKYESFTEGNFTITFAGGDNDGKYYTTGTGIRIYGGGSFTISSDEYISAISFAWDGSNSPTANVADVGTYDKNTNSWSGAEKSITFTRPSGSGHWRLQSLTVSYGTFESVTNVELRFGAEIPEATWTALEDKWEISDYGVMLIKRHAGSDPLTVSFVSEEYEEGYAPIVINTGHGNAPQPDDKGNYVFNVRVSITDTTSEKYTAIFCAAPFICVDGHYYFLNLVQKSVHDLATDPNVNTNLTSDGLEYLATH